MGKTFDVEAFRQSAAPYDARVGMWAYEGNLSYFDQSQWFGEPEYGSLYHDYAANNGTVEAACEFRSKLIRAVDQLFRIMDRTIERGNRFEYELAKSIQAEIVPEIDLIDEWLWEA